MLYTKTNKIRQSRWLLCCPPQEKKTETHARKKTGDQEEQGNNRFSPNQRPSDTVDAGKRLQKTPAMNITKDLKSIYKGKIKVYECYSVVDSGLMLSFMFVLDVCLTRTGCPSLGYSWSVSSPRIANSTVSLWLCSAMCLLMCNPHTRRHSSSVA